MTPEQGAFLLQSIFLPVYTAEHPVTKAVITAIPPDKADYRPDSIVRSAIDLASVYERGGVGRLHVR